MNRKPAIPLDHATRVMIEVIMLNDWHPADTVREQFGIDLADVEDQLFQPYAAPVEAAASLPRAPRRRHGCRPPADD